jgi:hypothetical protein
MTGLSAENKLRDVFNPKVITAQKLVIDFALNYVKANGKQAPKNF